MSMSEQEVYPVLQRPAEVACTAEASDHDTADGPEEYLSAPALLIRVPLEARMAFVDELDLRTQWISAGELADELDIYDEWVFRRVKELGIESSVRQTEAGEMPVYPPYTLAVLREEKIWRETFHDAPDRIGFGYIVELFGWTDAWTRNAIESTGILPRHSRSDGQEETYPKAILKYMRQINMLVPRDDDWLTLDALLERTRLDRDTALGMLQAAGLGTEPRRSSLSAEIEDHYPPGSEALLLDIIAGLNVVPGGDWLTADMLASMADRSLALIARLLEPYAGRARLRLDDDEYIRPHYPPNTCATVLRRAAKIPEYPEMGDYLNVDTIAKQVGHAAIWVRQGLEQLDIKPELRSRSGQRAYSYYPADTVERLRTYGLELEEEKRQADTLQALFAVGSLQSKIRARTQIIEALRDYGVAREHPQLTGSQAETAALRKKLRSARLRYDRLEGMHAGIDI